MFYAEICVQSAAVEKEHDLRSCFLEIKFFKNYKNLILYMSETKEMNKY